jgi:hypothetical protein
MEYGMGLGLSGSLHLQKLSLVHLQRLSNLCSIDILCIMPFFSNSHLIRSLPEPTLLWSRANGTFNDLTAEVTRHEHMRQRDGWSIQRNVTSLMYRCSLTANQRSYALHPTSEASIGGPPRHFDADISFFSHLGAIIVDFEGPLSQSSRA